ncbi:MAG TPA: hypothetical protein VGL33_16715, partial [Streptosporangiaceae bacterium]
MPQQSGWVRPEGGAPSETRASGYEPFDRRVASRARITGRGAAVSVASTGAVQIRPDHLYAPTTRQPPCGCSPADPG